MRASNAPITELTQERSKQPCPARPRSPLPPLHTVCFTPSLRCSTNNRVVHLRGQLDGIQNRQGRTRMRVPVSVLLGRFNRTKKTRSECGQRHSSSWGPNLKEKEKANRAPAFIFSALRLWMLRASYLDLWGPAFDGLCASGP